MNTLLTQTYNEKVTPQKIKNFNSKFCKVKIC